MRKRAKEVALGKVNLKNLVQDVVYRTGVKHETVDLIIRTTIDSIKQFMYNRTVVRLSKFGIFYLMKYRSSIRTLPSGIKVFRPAKYTPRFNFFDIFKKEIERIPTDEVISVKDTQTTINDLGD